MWLAAGVTVCWRVCVCVCPLIWPWVLWVFQRKQPGSDLIPSRFCGCHPLAKNRLYMWNDRRMEETLVGCFHMDSSLVLNISGSKWPSSSEVCVFVDFLRQQSSTEACMFQLDRDALSGWGVWGGYEFTPCERWPSCAFTIKRPSWSFS